MPRVSHVTAIYLITGVCGLVDAARFLSMDHVFAETMTGNLLFLCFDIGTGQSVFRDAKYLLVIVAFLRLAVCCADRVPRCGSALPSNG